MISRRRPNHMMRAFPAHRIAAASRSVRMGGLSLPFLPACLPPCSPCTRLDTMRRQLSPVVSPSDYSSSPSAYPQRDFSVHPIKKVGWDTQTTEKLGGVWDCSAPVFPAPLQLHGAKHI
jgi:hypothetical protein